MSFACCFCWLMAVTAVKLLSGLFGLFGIINISHFREFMMSSLMEQMEVSSYKNISGPLEQNLRSKCRRQSGPFLNL